MTLSHHSIRRIILAALVAFGPLAVAHARTQPPTNFNGIWSVAIVTTRGDCERAYRYPIAISGTRLVNAGSAGVDISGTVRANGAVAVRVSYGDKSARGSGRLTSNSGSGSWSGGACAGVWTAERQSQY
jgi:hypothetical protein